MIVHVRCREGPWHDWTSAEYWIYDEEVSMFVNGVAIRPMMGSERVMWRSDSGYVRRTRRLPRPF